MKSSELKGQFTLTTLSVFNYYYTVFRPTAFEGLNTDLNIQIFSDAFTASPGVNEEDLPFGPSTLPFWEENEVLYINLLNYMRNNDNADFATLSFPQNPLSDKKWNQYKEKPPDYIQQRQPYEDLFSKVGLTLHQSVLHGGIYNVRNFSTLPDLDDAKEVDMVSNNLGSAGHAETHLYYRQLLENQDQNLFKAPAGSGLPHNIWYDQYGIPNSYKLHYANINGVGQLQPNFVSASPSCNT